MHSRIPPTLTPEEISNLSKQIGTKNCPVRAPLKSILPDHFPLLLREAMAAEIDKDIHFIRNSPSRAFCRLMHHFLFHEQMETFWLQAQIDGALATQDKLVAFYQHIKTLLISVSLIDFRATSEQKEYLSQVFNTARKLNRLLNPIAQKDKKRPLEIDKNNDILVRSTLGQLANIEYLSSQLEFIEYLEPRVKIQKKLSLEDTPDYEKPTKTNDPHGPRLYIQRKIADLFTGIEGNPMYPLVAILTGALLDLTEAPEVEAVRVDHQNYKENHPRKNQESF